MNITPLLNQVNKDTFIEDYLTACGVGDIQEYLNPTGKYIDDPMDYENMTKGMKLIEGVVPKQSTDIYIVQDCD